MKKYQHFLVFCNILFFSFFLKAQNTVTFTTPDTVCTGEIVEVEYTGDAMQEYCWIGSPVFEESPFVREVVGLPSGTKPHFSDVVKENGNYFIFVAISEIANGANGDILRLDFGDNINNVPTQTLLTIHTISWGQEGIQILKDGDNWWGFLIGLEQLVRLNFGNSSTNVPTIEDLGNIGNLGFPHDLFITNENNEWVGLFLDKEHNTLNRLLFGNALSNTPTAEVVLSSFLNHPTGFFPIKVEGVWRLFITNEGNNNLLRLNFGNSLLNVPTVINLGDLGELNEPRDLSIYYICNQYCGIVGAQSGFVPKEIKK